VGWAKRGIIRQCNRQCAAKFPAWPRRQTATLAYLQDFRFKMWITLAAIPLILLLRDPSKAAHATTDEEIAAAID